jgi:hypothetical protein
MSVIWSWTYSYNVHWNNYLYFKGLLYIWEEVIMMALLHMVCLGNLLQDKYLSFSPSPLRLNIFRLFVILLFSTATFKYTPSDELDG